jgi:hypothetical protein
MLSLYKLCSVFGLFNDVARSTELTWHEVRNDMMIMNYVGWLWKEADLSHHMH